MNEMQKIIHEQFLEYGETLKEVEKEIIRKYKTGEDYSADVTRAVSLKMLKQECVRMMVEKR
jgi:predicted DNA-binding ArsR family transcriptional regulator